jgi:hypothetical protein
VFCVAVLLVACGETPAALPTPAAPAATVPPAADTPAPPVPTGAPTAAADRVARAEVFVEKLFQGDDAAVIEMLDATMKSALPPAKLQELRDTLNAQVGAFQRQTGTRTEKTGAYDVVYVTCEFEKMVLDVKVVFDAAGQVAGLFFAPAEANPAVEYLSPNYVDPASFTEQDVTVGSGEWALPGTLTMPQGDGPFPAVVFVHGSGPNDRDETIGPNKVFRDLAGGLATRGVAVLRYEKRTRQHADRFTGAVLATLTLDEETVDDAVAAAALLRQMPGIDPARVYVLGHSLGGMALPRIGAADPQVAGLISLAGSTRPLEDIVLEQMTYLYGLDGGLSADDQAALDELAAEVARVKDPNLSPDMPAADLPLDIPAAYWLDLRGYEPAAVAAGLDIPMLILQGERDYQVTTADFEGWRTALDARADVRFILYPDLNHLFMTGEGEGKGVPAEYEVAGHVAEQVIVDIAGWVLGED